MSTSTGHTVKAFDEDISRIRGMISEMGARAETAVTDAMTALVEHDLELAKTTVANDKLVDRLESEVEKAVVQTIALRAPMADDLRELIADLKMSAVIERVGDYAKNIAKRVGKLESEGFLQENGQIIRMGRIVTEMTRSVMDAYARRDVDIARAVHARDNEVDQIYKDFFVDCVAFVAKHPEAATEIAHLLFISKNLERAGDHVTTCAEMIIFTETGSAEVDQGDMT